MERLVLRYGWGGEPCCGETTVPFLYESKEKAEYDFLELCEIAKEKGTYFAFGGVDELDPNDFYYPEEPYYYYGKSKYRDFSHKEIYAPPDILTLDEWYKEAKGS